MARSFDTGPRDVGPRRRRPAALCAFAAWLVAAVSPGTAAAAPPDPLPWTRSYIPVVDLSPEQFRDELIAACQQDQERGVKDNGAVGKPKIAVLGDSVQVQTRSPAMADPAHRWLYATHCGERFVSALDSGRVADAVATRPDVLLIALGGNSFTENWQTRPDMLGPALADLERLLDATDSVPCRVIFDLPYVAPWFAGNEGDTWLYLTAELNKAIWAAEHRPGVHVAGWRDRIAPYWPAYLQDGLHLTRLGINEKINLALETGRQCLLPDSPADLGVVAGDATATIWWDELPAPEGVASYTVTASDGRSITTTGTTLNFPGLSNGTAYRFRVAATNARGTGPTTDWSAAVAPSGAGARLHTTSPVRVLDTRIGTGGKKGAFGPGEAYRLLLPPGAVPTGASAVVLNLTATGQTDQTFVTVWPGQQSRPLSSNLNPRPGVDAVPAMVTSRVAPDGSIQLFNNSGAVHLIADVIGWYGSPGDSNGALYAPVPPTRVLDTRDGTGGKATPFAGGEEYALTLPFVPAASSAVVLNLTATNTTQSSHVTVWPDGRPRPVASSLNPQRGLTRANLILTGLGPDRTLRLFNNSPSTDLVADLIGYYTSETALTGGSEYFPVTPERAYDTRVGTGGIQGPIPSTLSTNLTFAGRGAVPAAGVTAVDANFTVVAPTSDGHTTVWPSGPRPTVSMLNYRPGEVVANRGIITLSAGKATAWSVSPSIHYVIDVAGWFGPPR